MKTGNTYYTLKFRGSTGGHRSGDVVKNSSVPLTIGECADCEVKFERHDKRYAPEYYATILPNADGESWRIVKRSPHVDVSIVGHGGFSYVYNLRNGDVITFGGQRASLQFQVRNDARYDSAGAVTVEHKTSKWIYGIIIGLIAAMVLGGLWFYNRSHKEILYDDVSQFESSVLKISVDSVERVLMHGDTREVLASKALDEEKIVGTAFLTADGKLVTARHCVEYWLGEEMWPSLKIDSLESDDIRRWAAEVETFNIENEDVDSAQVLRVYCSVKGQSGDKLFTFTSDADSVHINREHDAIITLDDFTNRYYWRSITPYFNQRDMELGDIVWVDVPVEGKFKLASPSVIDGLSPNEYLAFFGFPKGEKVSHCADFEKGSLKVKGAEPLTQSTLVHSGLLKEGYSGGPVIARKGLGFAVVGVISKCDTINEYLMMSVPISEITSKKTNHEKR
ncbi:MAG: hypothetical protein IK092_03610 [Muribaculaceae bacterium]|nr:hypothetical protein [Muribaculaceae bacterium]